MKSNHGGAGPALAPARSYRGSRAVLFLFLDGVGLAPAGPHNPFSQIPMPHLAALLGGVLSLDGGTSLGMGLQPSRDDVVLRALDACLGLPGLPQSGTGQTALFTGVNAMALVGAHVAAYPTEVLRRVIRQRSLLKLAAEAGARVIFANAHSDRFWQLVREGRRRLAASTLAALAAGSDIPSLSDLLAGRAVLWDITHEIAAGHMGYELPVVSPEEAGERLARVAAEYDLVLYETFLPDLAGHGRIEPEWVLTRLDRFLGAVLAHLPPDVTLVLSSDHGNLEDASTKAHTTNPVPLLAVGPAAEQFCSAVAITDVAPAIVSLWSGAYFPHPDRTEPGESGTPHRDAFPLESCYG